MTPIISFSGVAAVKADHLDGIGHFHEPARSPPPVDWMTTGSGYTLAQFESLWSAIARRMLG